MDNSNSRSQSEFFLKLMFNIANNIIDFSVFATRQNLINDRVCSHRLSAQ